MTAALDNSSIRFMIEVSKMTGISEKHEAKKKIKFKATIRVRKKIQDSFPGLLGIWC